MLQPDKEAVASISLFWENEIVGNTKRFLFDSNSN